MLKTFDVVPCSRIFLHFFLLLLLNISLALHSAFLLDLFYNFFQLGFFSFRLFLIHINTFFFPLLCKNRSTFSLLFFVHFTFFFSFVFLLTNFACFFFVCLCFTVFLSFTFFCFFSFSSFFFVFFLLFLERFRFQKVVAPFLFVVVVGLFCLFCMLLLFLVSLNA